jgi:hypothetical protein
MGRIAGQIMISQASQGLAHAELSGTKPSTLPFSLREGLTPKAPMRTITYLLSFIILLSTAVFAAQQGQANGERLGTNMLSETQNPGMFFGLLLESSDRTATSDIVTSSGTIGETEITMQIDRLGLTFGTGSDQLQYYGMIYSEEQNGGFDGFGVGAGIRGQTLLNDDEELSYGLLYSSNLLLSLVSGTTSGVPTQQDIVLASLEGFFGFGFGVVGIKPYVGLMYDLATGTFETDGLASGDISRRNFGPAIGVGFFATRVHADLTVIFGSDYEGIQLTLNLNF